MINLHLFHGRSFVEIVKKDFEFLDTENLFIILEDHGIQSVNETIQKINDLQKEKGIRNLIIHNLDGSKAKIVNRIDINYNVHWCTWGYDIYNTHFGFRIRQFLSDKTLQVIGIKKMNPNIMYKVRNPLARKILLRAYRVLRRENHFYTEIESALFKMNTVSCVLPEEFEIVAKKIKSVKFRPYSYGTIESIIPEKLVGFDSRKLGTKILIGNSSSVSNNHADVFEKLGSKYQMIAPVSYGDTNYKEALMEKYPGKNIEYLLDFMEYDAYLKKLTEANTFIMNVYRQQGMANLNVALYLGMRVYLSPKNIAFTFYKELGIHIFSFPDDFSKYENSPLSDEQIQDNRAGLEKYYGREASQKRILAFQ
ncbi:MAG: TDP-N-acetylfucosamine:lipid II N-acetylfucosaminyltransferase [Crocinitomicaceae bacterium]|nr:TDP-N-acetylfucosamine:lipid II N-acetylfucosaminyltransferase [Crocinitomicaceae bacterium]